MGGNWILVMEAGIELYSVIPDRLNAAHSTFGQLFWLPSDTHSMFLHYGVYALLCARSSDYLGSYEGRGCRKYIVPPESCDWRAKGMFSQHQTLIRPHKDGRN